MDTTQKNREDSRQRRPQQGAKRPAQQRTQKEAQQAKRKKPAEAAGEKPRRSTRQTAAARSTRPKSGTAAPERQRSAGTKAPQQRTRQAAPQKKSAARQTGLADSVSNKKRAYGNSKPKKKNALQTAAEFIKNARKKKADTPEAKARKAARTKKRQQIKKQMEAPAVIYTQPQPFNRDRLIIQMVTVVAVVLAVVLGLSVFFKVENITVSGAEVYSAWAVREASGISEGDNLLTFSKIRAAGQIMAKLPYVEKVRIGIKLPDTVNIMIDEASVVYAIKSNDGTWWLMDSDGKVVEQANNATAAGCTQVLGVTLDNPVSNQRGVATEAAPTETNEAGELLPVTTTGALRLTAALKILNALEDNDIVGEAASVDVSNIEDIILWYGTRYQVNLGDSTQLEDKITWMNDVILQLSDYQTGVLDISFKIWPDQVGYTPFE